MSNKQLLLFAAAALLAPAAYEGVAGAENFNSQVSVIVPAPVNDTAPTNTVQTADGPIQKLRRTDQEQAGNEMPSFALFGKPGAQTKGLYFAVSTELNLKPAPNKVQLSLTPFTLTQDPTTHAVSAVADTAAAKFVTNNNGNERRNANNTTAMTVNDGSVICAKYNYQPNNTNNTARYIQCFNEAGAPLLPDKTRAYAKNNDDCSMHQDGNPGQVVAFDPGTNTTKVAEYAGCNGNGQDDGWVFVTTLTCNSAAAPTSCTFKNVFDVSVCPREERSRGSVSISTADPSFLVATWTEGNNQPQRDGVWMAAVDLAGNYAGSNQQKAILWKKQIAGRVDNPDGTRTYAQRAIQERIMQVNPKTGALEASDKVIFHWGDAKGNNNTNNGKGGTYLTAMYGVALPTRTGMTWVAPPVDLQYTSAVGLGNTHLGATAAVFGTTDKPMFGIMALSGSMTGGGNNAQLRPLAFDTSTNKFTDLGMQQAAPQDMHLYSNYLGNNPGNQGRNHSMMKTVANPFPGSTDAFLLIAATTGKTMADITKPQIKLTGLLTVTPIAQTPTVAGGGDPGTGSGSGSDPSTGGSDPGTTLGGCNAGGTSGGLATFFLIGLAAFIRRRR